MDAIFALAGAPRARAMERAAARVPGCLYICLWAPAPIAGIPPIHLFCLDAAWIGGDGIAGAGAGRVRELFEAYKGALFAVVSGCVPGWAFLDGAACMELPEPDLTASASLQLQLQFYHEAGIKMAVFMGCESGEIEVGLSVASPAAAGAVVAYHVQQSILEELLQIPPSSTLRSSSSSSLPPSVGSPEYSSIVRSIATSAQRPSSASPLQHGSLAPLYGPHEFPTAADDAMAQAIRAVISSSAPPPPRPSPPWHPRHSPRSSPRRAASAFKPYNAALSPRARPRAGAPGQRMIKTCISLLASVHTETRRRELATAAQHEETPAAAPPAATSSSQVHHMISERRRRERINDSFQALRALLPPGSKSDKATVLANTTAYMDKLISQVSGLQERNRQLEAQLHQEAVASGGGGDSSERVQVDVVTITGASTSTSTSDQPREVSIRVTVRAECDVSELLVTLLLRLKEMACFAVVSVDARQRSSSLAQASLTLQVAASDNYDETSLKEAVKKALEDAVVAPPPESP